MRLEARSSMLDAGKGSSIQDRASKIEHRVGVFVPYGLNAYNNC
ncbi:MAG: hypothetical protein AB1797_00595 [bacterium]